MRLTQGRNFKTYNEERRCGAKLEAASIQYSAQRHGIVGFLHQSARGGVCLVRVGEGKSFGQSLPCVTVPNFLPVPCPHLGVGAMPQAPFL